MLGGLHSNTLSDYHDRPVTRRDLAGYDGYSGYRGIGPVLNIGIIDIFRHREGFGSKLLDFIKTRGYELIELEVNGKSGSRFFRKNGFVDTE
jgi:ribosomal protein S18 acetylase RimI-like enzyme